MTAAITGMECLPKDIFTEICTKYLDLKTRAICCRVSKQWRQFNQDSLTDIGIMAANINKVVPAFIGYNSKTEKEVCAQVLKKNPEIARLKGIPYYDKSREHSIAFKGAIDANGKICFESVKRDNELKAVALEFDKRLSKKENETLSVREGNFVLEVFWKNVYRDHDENYPIKLKYDETHSNQLRHATEIRYPITYDINTRFPFQRDGISITEFKGPDSARHVLACASKFLTQCTISSIAFNSEEKVFDAEIWSEPLLWADEKTRPYI